MDNKTITNTGLNETNNKDSSSRQSQDNLKGVEDLCDKCFKPTVRFCSDNRFRHVVRWRIHKKIKSGVSLFSISELKDDIEKVRKVFFQKRTFSVAAVIFLSWMLTNLLLEKTSPFGIKKAADDYSEFIIDRIAAPFYGSEAQNEIVVVLINDNTLIKEGEAWPPHYDWYSRLLHRVLKNQPKAIFFDVQFNNYRADDKTLDKARKELEEDLARFKVPLILAQGADTSRKNVFGHIKGVELAPVEWSSFGRGYPLLLPANNSGEAQNDNCNPDQSIATPALRLYREACSADGSIGCVEPASLLSGEELCRPLTPHWGRAVSKIMETKKLVRLSECDLINPTEAERFRSFLKSIFHTFISGFDSDIMEKTRQPCSYTVTVLAHDLTNFDKVHDVLKGKIVLIGSGLSAMHDLVLTPVHGQLPGVYLHAMALDNLMTYGRDYYSHSMGSSFDFILVGMAILVSWAIAGVLRAKPRFYQFGLRLFAVLLIVALSFVLYTQYHYPAVHWLSFLLLYELIIRVIHQERH